MYPNVALKKMEKTSPIAMCIESKSNPNLVFGINQQCIPGLALFSASYLPFGFCNIGVNFRQEP
jgi:hypothetical protein